MMKKIITSLFLGFSILSNAQVNTVFTSGGISYIIKSTSTVAVDASNYVYGVVEIPASVTQKGITYSVTSIEPQAFRANTGLTAITIPSSVTSIGSNAFFYCLNLTKVVVYHTKPLNIDSYIFTGGVDLSKIALYVPLGTIDAYKLAFVWRDFGSISRAPYVVGETFMNNSIVYKVSKTQPAEVSVGITSIIKGIVNIPETVTNNGVTYSVTRILQGAFSSNFNKEMTSVIIPNTVTYIEANAFSNCTGLKSVVIPGSVTYIDFYAFSGCTGLNTVAVGHKTPLSISQFVFDGVSLSSKSLYVPTGTIAAYGAANVWKNFGNIMLKPNVVGDVLTKNGMKYIVTSISPAEVKVAGNGGTASSSTRMADYSYRLEASGFVGAATIPVSVSENGVTYSVTSIGDSAFAFSSGLTSVNIPSSVTSIGNRAFLNCTSLTSVEVNQTTPLVIPTNVFDGVTLSNATLYVPTGSVVAYGAANVWKDFGNITTPVVTLIGTENQLNTIFSVYPNPSNGTFSITSTSELGNVSVVNSIGTLIYLNTTSAKQLNIELPSKEAGIYFVKVGNKMTKLIKE